MELHHPPIGGPPDPALLDYIGRHYDFGISRDPVHEPLGCRGVLHAERRNPGAFPDRKEGIRSAQS
jgi:hypothetical protein